MSGALPAQDIDAESQLGQWVRAVLDDDGSGYDGPYGTFALPSNAVADALLRRIGEFEEEDARTVLRALLIPTGSLGVDRHHEEWVRKGKWRGHLTTEECVKSPVPLDERSTEYERRLLDYADDPSIAAPPWEGITWVLDLLPSHPEVAIDCVSGYILAHAQVLPDGRYAGLVDALALIRARYIGLPGDATDERQRSLLKLSPRAFERIVERYFDREGYSTRLTKASNDYGRDVIAERSVPPPAQRVLVQCKNWARRVGRPDVQQLAGVVTGEKAPSGMMVATSGFTGPAMAWARDNPRITLLGSGDLVRELNRVLGSDWPVRIDRLIIESEAHTP